VALSKTTGVVVSVIFAMAFLRDIGPVELEGYFWSGVYSAILANGNA
jgi:hypothetical protein